MKHISLFSGIGGIDLAAHWAGFTTVQLVENNSFCTQVLEKNFPNVPIHEDIRNFDGKQYAGNIELISAGFPCQPHSVAGKRKASSDERNLWGEVVRIISEVRPRWFLGENVQGLLTSEKGEFFSRIINDLEQMGYSVGWCVYGAKDVGAVHRRNRIFIVAYSKEQSCYEQPSNFTEERKESESFRVCNCGKDVTNSESNANGGELLSGLWSELEARAIKTMQSKKRRRNRATTYANCAGWEKQWWGSSDATKFDTIERNIYQKIAGRNWRAWGISPICIESRVRGSNDGIPNRLDRLKCLGNAVVPQQVFPILLEMAKISNLLHKQISRCIK